MKKAVCLLLALAVTAACSASAAVVPAIKGTFGFDQAAFSAQADAALRALLPDEEWTVQTDPELPWTATYHYQHPETNFSVMTLESVGDGLQLIELYTMIPADGSGEETQSYAKTALSVFSVVIAASYSLEHGAVPEDFDAQLRQEAEELFSLLDRLSVCSREELDAGVSNVCTVRSYPCALTAYADNDEDRMYHLMIDVLPAGGTFYE